MSMYKGSVSELEPTTLSFAEVTPERLTIRYPGWVVEATSRDGFLYEGSYGEGRVDPRNAVRLRRYTAPNGSVVLYGEWKNEATQGYGEWVFRLFEIAS